MGAKYGEYGGRKYTLCLNVLKYSIASLLL